jgi:dethiobiotin synthetase
VLDSLAGIRLVVVGTGTGVGKTHVACALLRHLRDGGLPIVGLKPIETGLEAGGISDQGRLLHASTGLPVPGHSPAAFHVKQPTVERELEGSPFHVKPSPYWFGPPLSPHLAARNAGQRIDLGTARAWVLEAQELVGGHAALVETAGGLFSPLGPGTTNLDLVLALEPAVLLLVAPDRLGVLHDVASTLGLADARGRPVDAVVLSEPETPDGSTGRNAQELSLLGIARICAVFPRGSDASPATRQQAQRLVEWIDNKLTKRSCPLQA